MVSLIKKDFISSIKNKIKKNFYKNLNNEINNEKKNVYFKNLSKGGFWQS